MIRPFLYAARRKLLEFKIKSKKLKQGQDCL